MTGSKGARAAGKRGATGEVAEQAGEASFELGEVLEFMRLLWGVNHGLDTSSKQMDARLGVTGPQRLVIRIVGRHPGISAGSLAGVMHVHPSTLTGVLRRLEGRGLLLREVDPADGRRALFGLTARGREVDALRSGTVEARVRSVLSKLGPGRVKAAQEVLEALARALAPARERPARDEAPAPRRPSARKPKR